MTYPYYYPQNNNSGFIWVQGEAGAKSYLVAPGSTVQLWDSESQTIYLKSADASGMPSMKILDYTIRSQDTAPRGALLNNQADIPTRKDLEALQDQINALKAQIEGVRDE